MPFEIVRNDITNMQVDAIVNSANPRPVVGLGTDAAIHEKAGPRLLEARRKIGPIAPGQAAITPGYDLPARYVVHTVGPVWDGGSYGEEKLLRSCYDRSLALAWDHGCRSIAFPLIATNNYGFPRDRALQIAIAAFSDFLMDREMQICLVVFDRQAYKLSERLFHSISSYIDDHYVDRWNREMYGSSQDQYRQSQNRQRRDLELYRTMPMAEAHCAPAPCDPAPRPKKSRPPLHRSLAELLKKKDAGFAETLFRYIDKTGKKDSEIYKKANLSKQHFSKIRNNPDYRPTKATALALAIALELDMAQTKDLIGRAGYALTNSSVFDLIICYFIEEEIYDIMQINMALYEFDQSLLGA